MLLISEGFEKQLNVKEKEVFRQLIPESEELTKQRDSSIKELIYGSEKERINAARFIFKEARKDFSWKNSEWLGDPRMIDILLSALNNKNKKVVTEVTGALWMINNNGRYLKD